MLLRFPTCDVLRTVLADDAVPPAVRQAGGMGAIDAKGRVWLRPAGKLARSQVNRLRRAGAAVDPPDAGLVLEPFTDWLELLPLIHLESAPADNALLWFADGSSMLQSLAEMRRLGHTGGDCLFLPDELGVLLRVTVPPTSVLLRPGLKSAYRQAGHGAWVEWGWQHPLESQLGASRGELLLIDSPRTWRRLRAGRWISLHGTTRFVVQRRRSRRDGPTSHRVTVPIVLRPSSRAEPVELWLLPHGGDPALHRLVRSADERLLEKLDLAFGDHAGRIVAILKAPPGKSGSPVLVLDEPGFSTVLKFPNLFAPSGAKLHPPLQREAWRNLLARDADRLIWLQCDPAGMLESHGIALTAFRPILGSVDYVVENPHQPLQPISLKPCIGFEPFEMAEHGEKKRTASSTELTSQDVDVPFGAVPTVRIAKGIVPVEEKKDASPRPVETVDIPVLSRMPDAAAREHLADLQTRFLAVSGPLDHQQRLSLWRPLGDAHAVLLFAGDAALCWLNVLWTTPHPIAALLHDWLHTEQRAAGWSLSAGRLDALLAEPTPLAEHLRFVAAHLIASLYQTPSPFLKPRAGALAHYLEQHDAWLPVRAAWLAALGLSKLTGDTLALARTRDRILNQLLESGLNRDRDLPAFLRGPGPGIGAGTSADRDQMHSLFGRARVWAAASHDLLAVDMTFAFAFARLGETVAAQELVESARRKAKRTEPALYWLFRAYQNRVQEAIAGQGAASLNPALLAELSKIKSAGELQIINLRRRHSRILEPFEKIDPFRDYREFRDDRVGRELADLSAIADNALLAGKLGALLQSARAGRGNLRVLAAALSFAPRLGDGFCGEVLTDLESSFPLMPREPDLFRVLDVLERGLILAAHTGRDDRVGPIVARLRSLLAPIRGERLAWIVAHLNSPLFRTLGKVGLGEQARELVEALTDGVLESRTLSRLRKTPAVNWGIVLRALAHLAGGWFYLDRDEFGTQLLDEANARLEMRNLRDQEQADLADSYAAALGQAPPEIAWPRIHALFDRLGRLGVGYQGAIIQPELRTIESAVLAVVAKDFSAGSRVRRWLDEDEHIIRRRIHADMT